MMTVKWQLLAVMCEDEERLQKGVQRARPSVKGRNRNSRVGLTCFADLCTRPEDFGLAKIDPRQEHEQRSQGMGTGRHSPEPSDLRDFYFFALCLFVEGSSAVVHLIASCCPTKLV